MAVCTPTDLLPDDGMLDLKDLLLLPDDEMLELRDLLLLPDDEVPLLDLKDLLAPPDATPADPCVGATRARRGTKVTMSQLRAVQTLSLREAADALRMGTTQFKTQCRRLGVKQWPHRKLKSLSSLVDACQKAQGCKHNAKFKEQLDTWVELLLEYQARRHSP